MANYSKRPIWYWILIYLIIAIIVYGLIYLIFFYRTGYNSNNSVYQGSNSAYPTATANLKTRSAAPSAY